MTGLGGYVKARREAMGVTLTALAERAGMSKSALSALEKGRVNLPNAGTRRRLAKALGVRHVDVLVAAGELLKDETEPSADPYPFDSEHATVAALLPTLSSTEARTLRAVADALIETREARMVSALAMSAPG